MTRFILAGLATAILAGSASAGFVTERIIAEGDIGQVLPSSTVPVLFLLRDNSTPIFGYSLDIDITPDAGALGSVTANIDLTNFFDQQNLIAAGGAMRDVLASEIVAAGANGVFISTNTDDLSAIVPVLGVNDVLAQVFFDVSPDALGTFTVELGPASVLSDAMGQAVTFDFSPSSITVIPEPSTLILLSLGLGAAVMRRRSKRC